MTNNATDELLPCPFCGGVDVDLFMEYHPQCSKCGAIQVRIIGRDAVAAWNTRTTPAEPKEV